MLSSLENRTILNCKVTVAVFLSPVNLSERAESHRVQEPPSTRSFIIICIDGPDTAHLELRLAVRTCACHLGSYVLRTSARTLGQSKSIEVPIVRHTGWAVGYAIAMIAYSRKVPT